VENEEFKPTDFGWIKPEGAKNKVMAVSNGNVVLCYTPGDVDSKKVLYRAG